MEEPQTENRATSSLSRSASSRASPIVPPCARCESPTISARREAPRAGPAEARTKAAAAASILVFRLKDDPRGRPLHDHLPFAVGDRKRELDRRAPAPGQD